jgi:hypothetical protein
LNLSVSLPAQSGNYQQLPLIRLLDEKRFITGLQIQVFVPDTVFELRLKPFNSFWFPV